MPPSTAKQVRPSLRLAHSDRVPRRDAGSAPEPSLDDSQLLEALRRGDPSAATALHDRARPQVDRTIARLLGRSDVDRDDIAQLAMIELVTSASRFRGDCSLDGWISILTARVVYKQLRRRKLERKIFEAPVEEHDLPAAVGRSSERGALARDLIERVRKHLDGIDPNKAWTFLLHDVYGYDLREIADITGASVAAAQTRLTRGRRELHERIASDPELARCLAETSAGTEG
jgi:RNA polymerase sigma-70 factor (ECF subfamily)